MGQKGEVVRGCSRRTTRIHLAHQRNQKDDSGNLQGPVPTTKREKKGENLAIKKIWYPVLRNALAACTVNRTDQRRIYNGCTPDNESFVAESPK
ncbi:hypothetical protein Trydic_g18282 [Trypoxylus dichotomus]